MKAVQIYSPTSSHEDQIVESFYVDVESAMAKIETQYTVLIGDFNAKIAKKPAGDHEVEDIGIVIKNNRGDLLVKFSERIDLRIMDTFFRKRENRKWTRKSLNGKTEKEIDFILRAHPCIVHDVEVTGKGRGSTHRMVRSRIVISLQRKRRKLYRKKPMNEFAVREKQYGFKSSIDNRYSALTEDGVLRVQAINDNLNNIITECTVEVGRGS